ncbi:P-loop containing nucleoside triphosphate hydrolase protein [Dunaliella salina]|uniref:DNA 3'-5' helicase n=1 Tax=Dunaliella salina TaxID=3046 RepID=A0ABQ7GDV1_DUNSA|nr:P-loop containing nucleoside triphosphate hydrolase protein [Dunaliella salina]|eukprot:KAF5832759.1 P-loop containing nucleoside triphosphate hydrolase protein [Dunaliella salina]
MQRLLLLKKAPGLHPLKSIMQLSPSNFLPSFGLRLPESCRGGNMHIHTRPPPSFPVPPQNHPTTVSSAANSSTCTYSNHPRLRRRRALSPVPEREKPQPFPSNTQDTAGDAATPTTSSWQAKADAFLSTLNAEQMKAATTRHHAVRIKAGPGSGKTRVVAARVAWLLRSQVPPSQLLVITFTNKAAGELKERIAGILGPTVARAITAGTFHSICARILRRNVDLLKCGLTDGFTIYDTDDTVLLTKRFLEEHDEYGYLSTTVRGKLAVALCGAFSKVKNMVPTTFGTSIPEVFKVALARREIALPPLDGVNMARLKDPYQLAGLFTTYNSKLRSCNAVDFDDLLGLTVALLKRKDVQSFYNSKFKCVLVDEFQDTNEPQYALSRLLKGDTGSLFVVGDPDQAVYSWRGANPSIFLDSFAQQYRDAATYFLNTNHRSGAHILRCAEAVLSHSGLPHMHETLNAARPGGPGTVHHITVFNEYAEALEVASQIKRLQASGRASYKDIAVLYRSGKTQAFLLKKQLTASGIPYVVLGDRSLWEKAEIKDAMAFLRLVANPLTDSVALERVINKPPRGIGPELFKKLKANAAEQGMSLAELLFKDCAQVWLPRDAVEEKLQEIMHTVAQCRKDFYEGKKNSKDEKKVLSQDKAKEIIEKVKMPLTSMQAAPDLSSLPLPAAAKKNPGAQGLRQIRELIVLARNVARYTDNLGVSEDPCLDSDNQLVFFIYELLFSQAG